MYNEKHTGRDSGKQAGKMRLRRSKSTALILALILLLGMTIGGTVAYLIREANSVENGFIPANVTIDIQETFNNNIKEAVVIENTSASNIPVYIRVALVGNWADVENKICINHTGDPLAGLALGNDWKKGNDGFYYYTKSVAVGEKTSDLLGSNINLSSAKDGCSYQLEVIASAIQAQGDNDTEPETAVFDAWGIDPTKLQ